MLLERGASIEATTTNGTTVLHGAAAEGRATTAELLLALGCKVDAADSTQSTALLLAAGNGHAATAAVLLRAGADVEATDICRRTPLNRAAINGSTETVAALLAAGADLESRDADSWTPLLCSAVNGNEIIVKLLLDSGAKIEAADAKGLTALHHAAGTKGDHASIVAMLLEHGAAVDVLDIHGATPTWMACEHDSPESLEVLLAHGADLSVADQRYEQTPVDVAIANGSPRAIHVLRGVPGLELPDLPEDDLPRGGRSDGQFTVRKGAMFLQSSLSELQRIVDEGGQIFPRRLRAQYQGEEAYGEGVTRQWIGQFGRTLLTFCDREADRPSAFSVSVGEGTAAAALSVKNGFTGVVLDEVALVRGKTYTFIQSAEEHRAHPFALFLDQGGQKPASGLETEVSAASGIVQTKVTLPKRFPAATVWLGVQQSQPPHPPPQQQGAATAEASTGIRFCEAAVIEAHLTHCRKHGSVQKSRCAVVVGSSDALQVDGQCPKPPLATTNLLENTDGALRPHQCFLGTAACYLLVMLTRAILMLSLFQRPRQRAPIPGLALAAEQPCRQGDCGAALGSWTRTWNRAVGRMSVCLIFRKPP